MRIMEVVSILEFGNAFYPEFCDSCTCLIIVFRCFFATKASLVIILGEKKINYNEIERFWLCEC